MLNCTYNEEPPYAERHVRWCERSENEVGRKLLSFSSYSIIWAVGGLQIQFTRPFFADTLGAVFVPVTSSIILDNGKLSSVERLAYV